MSNLERYAAIAGVMVPIVFVIWGAATLYDRVAENTRLITSMSGTLSGVEIDFKESRAHSESIHTQATAALKDIEWLKYHHHHDEGEGRPHVD